MDIGLLEDIFTDIYIIPRAVLPLHKTYFCELMEMDRFVSLSGKTISSVFVFFIFCRLGWP